MLDARVAGIRFRNAGKIMYVHTAGMRLEAGEYVVVETVRGPEIGKVVIAPGEVVVNELNTDDLKPILRLATDEDLRRMDRLRMRAEELLPEARSIAADAGFPVRIDAADFTLDGRRLTFSFTSEERLDYRDFVRRAAERFGAKVDMRQLGARDRAKLAGGYGICGRELCCANWLTTFPSISIRMAKEQDLPLNPQKISGLCGRLLCCLSYEEEGYREMRRTLPKMGQRCSTPTGEGRVISINMLRREVTLVVEGQRVEVKDRDLGLVVRWDPSSKAGDPPPSISRAEAIAQGLIEATEEDVHSVAAPDEPDWITAQPALRLPGRGPGDGSRREGGRGRPDEGQRGPAREGRGRGPQGQGLSPEAGRPVGGQGTPRREVQPGPRQPGSPRQGRPGPNPELQGRPFRRSADAPPPPGRPQPAPGDAGPGARDPAARAGGGRRRGRRGGRGRGGPGGDGGGSAGPTTPDS
jgi:cell fate regulator YaaT (PSP1 superfamily)